MSGHLICPLLTLTMVNCAAWAQTTDGPLPGPGAPTQLPGNTETMGIEPMPSDSERVIPAHRGDVEMTLKVREELEKMELSPAAKKVGVSTYRGQVTLRGEVASNDERSTIVDVANRISHNVRNQLSVRK